ncbi:PIN domain-containing protein [Tenacibaculum sp. M341]|uniref:PIN domain-containing protein n=1 Tax=Tenacibaculum sp. M341 TaxID=2530339 RepID=UPI0010502952|nr:PIN domain-containing protein [Tenacibaculum sp. M341]TCI84514.1 hypothetical protein EYW44_20950 [Tenacibaculum sp. M341]
MKEKEYDIFVNQKIYPNASEIFGVSLSSLNKIKGDCKIVFDTNALLVPYLTGSDSLNELKKVFEKLKKQKRLVIPGQVAREFANNRPEKLKEVYQQLTRKQNGLQSISIGKYPLLENIKEYKEAIELEAKLNEQITQYRKKIKSLVNEVKSWNWNDPISEIYKDVFTKGTVLDLKFDENEVKEKLQYRYLHKIPPGFKDDNKPDDGVGDFLIWLTILKIAEEKQDVIFVSGDEKTDWYHKSEKNGLYPRFELVNEYRIASGGKSFHILKFSELLNLLGADDKVVREVAKEERHQKSKLSMFREFVGKAENAIMNWLLQRDDLGVIPNNGFPDFEVNYDDGTKSGVDVVPINSQRNSGLISMHFRERFYRAYYEVQEKDYDKFQFYFVVETRNYPFNELRRNIERSIKSFNMETAKIEYFIGYLDQSEEFNKV